MADIKLVIKIDEETYNFIKRTGYTTQSLYNAIINGTPLPKGHWVGIEYDGYADGNPVFEVWECSECGWEHNGAEDTLTCYCPNCGADMRGDDNGK